MQWRSAIIAVVAIEAAGSVSGALSGANDSVGWFAGLAKPAFMPPTWAFPVAWTILYALMGLAIARVLEARGAARDRAVRLFALQLLLNLAWAPLFFAGHSIAGALALILLLDLAVLATIVAFARVDRLAAWLLVPYAAWLTLATALNLAILRLN